MKVARNICLGRVVFHSIVSLLGYLILAGCSSTPNPPKVAHVHRIHGKERLDNYHWMRDETRKNPTVLAHLKNENKYADKYFEGSEALQTNLYNEMVGRLKEDDSAVPYFDKGYFYYSRSEKGKNHPIFCRKKGSMDANEQVLLDLNQLAKTKTNVKLGGMAVSPNQKVLAYALDEAGTEKYSLYFKDIDSGQIYVDRIEDIAAGFVWAEDNRHVFYIKRNKAFRRHRAYVYEFGRRDSSQLLYEERDEAFDLSFSKTADDLYIKLRSSSTTSSEVRFIESRRPRGKWRFVQKRQPKLEYSVEHRNGLFYILNNRKATNFKISKARVSRPGIANWEDMVPHDKEALIIYQMMQKDRLIYMERRDGLVKLRYVRFKDGARFEVKFDEPVYHIYLGANPQYRAKHVRIIFQSPVTPPVTYDYHFPTKKFHVKKKKEVPNYNPELYETKRVFVKARDTAMIPVTLVHRRGVKAGDKKPLLLYGYGSYGATIAPTFRSRRFSLIDRDFIFGIAHIRGSQAKGRIWYDNGKLDRKHNTFNDFEDVAKSLIADGYTTADKMVMRGRSAGGLLMGAVMNQAPDLFAGVVAGVPFVDVVTTILDSNLRFSTQEYQEWGNPNEADDYAYMMTYSPYDNVRKTKYPALFARAGVNDTRVNYWEPAKWVAKLRDYDQGDKVKLLRTQMTAGHGGSSGRYEAIKEEAEVMAFILKSVE